MKKTILVTIALLSVFSASAVVGGPEPGEGELAITSGGSTASGSTAVGPNGTTYSSTVEMSGRNSNTTIGDTVENVSQEGKVSTFNGYIQAPTPCHVIDQRTEKISNGKYSINVQTVKENKSQQCVQQVVIIMYNGSFEAETPYELEISHNNQSVETIEAADIVGPDPKDKRKKGIFPGIMDWLEGIF